jgi:hypothetical protein
VVRCRWGAVQLAMQQLLDGQTAKVCRTSVEAGVCCAHSNGYCIMPQEAYKMARFMVIMLFHCSRQGQADVRTLPSSCNLSTTLELPPCQIDALPYPFCCFCSSRLKFPTVRSSISRLNCLSDFVSGSMTALILGWKFLAVLISEVWGVLRGFCRGDSP